MITIDGRNYPLWSKFVEGKARWIGGELEEFSDGICDGAKTTITDITLSKEPDSDGVFFTVHGKDFNDSFNVKYGGVSGSDPGGGILFTGVGFTFAIRERKKV